MKITELKLEHVLAYVAHGVKGYAKEKIEFRNDSFINAGTYTLSLGNVSDMKDEKMLDKIFMQLRPMSEFPTQCWYDEDQNEYMIEWDNEGMELMIRDNNPSHVGQPLNALACHELMQTVFEGHYDLFDLIGQNLAIDINTL